MKGSTRLGSRVRIETAEDVSRHVAALESLSRLHALWSVAANELQTTMASPTCVEGCGLCCEANTPLALGVEADWAASWLLSQPSSLRTKVLDRLRGWLLEQGLVMVWPKVSLELNPLRGSQELDPESRRTLAAELSTLVRGPCPLLGEDRHCLVYEGRPLACRAYAVSRLPGPYCKRPLGLGETNVCRAVWEGEGAEELRHLAVEFLSSLTPDPRLHTTSVLATAIYRRFRARDLERITSRVASAKLVESNAYTAILFQSQDDGHALMAHPIATHHVRLWTSAVGDRL